MFQYCNDEDEMYAMLKDAYFFFKQNTSEKIEISQTGEQSYDIMKFCDKLHQSIEIGSYGIRTITHNAKKYEFIYGTGLALPRFTC